MRTCDIKGCEEKHKAKGLCSTHYMSVWWPKYKADHRTEIKEKDDRYNESRLTTVKKYGITLDEFEFILSNIQGGVCGICGTTEPTNKRKRFSVDHDHGTGIVRGILCERCNTGLGFLNDNAETVAKALAYLLKEPITLPPRKIRKVKISRR